MRYRFAAVVALVLASCTDLSNPTIPIPPGACSLPAASQEIANDAVSTLAADYARSAAFYYQAMASQSGSFALPALALSTGMAEIYSGSTGSTADQIATALGWQTNPNAIAAAHAALGGEIAGLAAQGNVLVTCGTRLWLDTSLNPASAWSTPLQSSFGTTTAALELMQNNAQSLLSINAWVTAQTKDRLPGLLATGDVPTGTLAVLTVAQDVIAAWTVPYTDNPNATVFYPLTGTPSTTNMLFSSQATATATLTTSDVQAADLLLDGNGLAVLLVMPLGSFSDYEKALDGNTLTSLFAQLQTTQAVIAVPPFEVQFKADLTSALQAGGIVDLFSSSAALSQAFPSGGVSLGNVHAETQLIFSPGGVGTSTDPAFGDHSPDDPTLIFNHPFLFVLHDVLSKTAVIVGRYVG